MTFQEPVHVRLRGGSKPNEGYVEIKAPSPINTWGGVCDDGIGKPEADVICRMLGYPHGSQTAWQGPGSSQEGHRGGSYLETLLPKHSFGHGSGSILLDNLDCTGNEDSVIQCKHRTWGSHNCIVDGAKHEWLGVTCLVSFFNF